MGTTCQYAVDPGYKLDAMMEKSLILIETHRQEAIHEKIAEKKLQLEVFNQVVMEEAVEEFRNIQKKFLFNALEKVKQYEKECEEMYEEVLKKESEFDKKYDRKLEIANKVQGLVSKAANELNKPEKADSGLNTTTNDSSVRQPDQTLKNKIIPKEVPSDKPQESKGQVAKSGTIDATTITAIDMDLEKTVDETSQPSKPTVSKQGRLLSDAIELQKFCFDFEASLKEFTANPVTKSYMNELQLFIRTLINTIANGTITQLRHKASQLHNLFSKKSVCFQEKNVHCNNHPKALDFSIYFAAKTFISVGAKQIASLAKAAYPMGAIIALLWSHHELFGKLFVALLQDKCPYVVPYYPVKDDKESDIDYYIACGYNFAKDGKTLESEDAYLNRMRAMIMLYSAALQTPISPKNSFRSYNHGWTWLARILDLDPRPAISAAVVQAFIQISSFTMLRVYGKQYFKLIKYISSVYVPKIKEITTKDVKRQTVVQLELFVDNCIKSISLKGSLEQPEGFVGPIPVNL